MKVQKHTQIAQLRAAILGSVLIILGTMAFPAPTRAEELVSGRQWADRSPVGLTLQRSAESSAGIPTLLS